MIRTPSFHFLLFIMLLFSLSLCRPFDWQHSRINIPFAVFYNPSLLGNNPGYTFGLDAGYIDSANYNIRGAAVIPIGAVADIDWHIQRSADDKHFKYPNVSRRSGRTALSVGGMYAGDDCYQITAGFTAPVSLIQTGASVDAVYRDRQSILSLNAGLSADIKQMMGGGILHLMFHNIAANERNGANDFGFSIGSSGIPFSDSRWNFAPYDVNFRFHIKSGNIDAIDGTLRLNFDFGSAHITRGSTGTAVTGSVGYNFFRRDEDDIDHKVFAALGVTFINRSSAASFSGGYIAEGEMYGSAAYSSFKKERAEDGGLRPALSFKKKEDNNIIFDLRNRSQNIKSWVLRIDGQTGSSIKTFSGGNVVPSSILWDGLMSDGSEVLDETITARLVLISSGRIMESNTVVIEK